MGKLLEKVKLTLTLLQNKRSLFQGTHRPGWIPDFGRSAATKKESMSGYNKASEMVVAKLMGQTSVMNSQLHIIANFMQGVFFSLAQTVHHTRDKKQRDDMLRGAVQSVFPT